MSTSYPSNLSDREWGYLQRLLPAQSKRSRPAAIQKMRAADLERAREPYARQTMSVAEIMLRTGFRSRTTFYKYVVNVNREKGQQVDA